MDKGSRLIIKNIPIHYTEERLKQEFGKMGIVTDAKIMRKGEKSRLFAFLGYKNTEDAEKARKYFNNTFLDTSKIVVEFAKAQDDLSLPRAWSKYTKGSTAWKSSHKEENKNKDGTAEEEQEIIGEETKKRIEHKKEKLKEFLELMAKKANKQTWNDSFAEFMDDTPKKKIKVNPKQKKKKDIEQNKTPEIVPIDKNSEANIDENRLYIMNLPFTINEDEIRSLLSKYGILEEVTVPTKYGQGLGFAFVRFYETESAISAFAELDKTFYQGRKLHIKPAIAKPPPKEIITNPELNAFNREKIQKTYEEFDLDLTKKKDDIKSSFKRSRDEERKKNYDNETNWNYLFLNPDSVASSMSKKLNIKKGELLSKDSDNLAVRMALSETQIIKETKEWMYEQGIDLSIFEKGKRQDCERSDKIILVKNISNNTQISELRDIFSRYGTLVRLIVSPSNTLAIVEYSNSKQAEVAVQKLSYYRIKDLPLYLEFAPMEIFTKNNVSLAEIEIPLQETANKSEGVFKEGKTIFVKNLNFTTTEKNLEKVFKDANIGKVLSAKIVRTDDNKSRGYGFIEMENETSALNAIKKLQSTIINDHSLQLSISMRKTKDEEAKKLLKKRVKKSGELAVVDNEDAASTKLLVKNLAFQATKQDLSELFKHYGKIKRVTLPKKFDGGHRGFGFVEFLSREEAKNAFKSLKDSHMYGRKLVIEWAKVENNTVDEILNKTKQRYEAREIEPQQKKFKKAELRV